MNVCTYVYPLLFTYGKTHLNDLHQSGYFLTVDCILSDEQVVLMWDLLCLRAFKRLICGGSVRSHLVSDASCDLCQQTAHLAKRIRHIDAISTAIVQKLEAHARHEGFRWRGRQERDSRDFFAKRGHINSFTQPRDHHCVYRIDLDFSRQNGKNNPDISQLVTRQEISKQSSCPTPWVEYFRDKEGAKCEEKIKSVSLVRFHSRLEISQTDFFFDLIYLKSN